MATFLDVTGLQYFTSLFVFIFSWALIYSVFIVTRVLGDNKVIPALIAFVLSLLVILNPVVFDIIKSTSPWIGFVFVIVMILLPVMKVLIPTMEESTLGVRATVLMIILFIVVIGIVVKVREQVKTSEDETDFSKVSNVILHPKILGAILLLIISVFTISLLTIRGV